MPFLNCIDFTKNNASTGVKLLAALALLSPASVNAQDLDYSPIDVVFQTNVRIEGNTEKLTGGVTVQCSVGANWSSFVGSPVTWESEPVIVQEVGPIAAPIVIPVTVRIENISRSAIAEYNERSQFEWSCFVYQADGSGFTATTAGSPGRTAVRPAFSGTCDRASGVISAATLESSGASSCAR